MKMLIVPKEIETSIVCAVGIASHECGQNHVLCLEICARWDRGVIRV